MSVLCVNDAAVLDRITQRALHRRRRREFGEGQPPRCPLCQWVMVPYISRHGPGFRCACNDAEMRREKERQQIEHEVRADHIVS